MINKLLGMGYLGSKPEFQEYKSGKCKASFSIGINYGKETTWVEIECWDRIAENANKYLEKGSLVFVEGKLKYSSWKDKNGASRNKLYCVCDFLKVINSKNSNDTKEEVHKVSEIKESDIELQKDLEDIPW